MKQLIRRWFGIKDPVVVEPMLEIKLRKMVGSALVTALEGKQDEVYYGYGFNEATGNQLNRVISRAAVQAVRQVAENTAKDVTNKILDIRINNEDFIDNVVGRINKKQL